MKTTYIKSNDNALKKYIQHLLKKRNYKIIDKWEGENHFIYYHKASRLYWDNIHKECKLINQHPISYILSDKNELSFLTEKRRLNFMPYSFTGVNGLHIKRNYKTFINKLNIDDIGIDLWLAKPPKGSLGTDIQLMTTVELLNPYHDDIFYDYTIQKYIENPLLLEGRKFDFRLYVLFTQENELYIYPYFTTKYCFKKYDIDNISDLSLHLTNFAIQKKEVDVLRLEDVISSEEEFWRKYEKEYGKRFDLISAVGQMMIKIFDLSQDYMKQYKKNRYYQLFGIDVMMDRSHNYYLIEFNRNPGFSSGNKVLNEQRDSMIDDIFKLTIDKIFDNRDEKTDFIFLKKY
jgi:hypothetical protein